MRRLIPAACLALTLPVSAFAQTPDLPPALVAFAAEQAAVCTGLGGTPRVGPAFATSMDLNGDGAIDYVVDLAGVECANAWSAFCGSAGCPLSVWIAGPGGLRREWSDMAQGWSLDGQGDAVAVLVDQHGGACPEPRSGAETCQQRLAFDAPPPAPAPEAATPQVPAPAPVGSAPDPIAAAAATATAASGIEGWTLREVAGGTPVAVSDGPGGIATVAVFCLAGQPFLAARLREPPAAETAQIEFAFAGRSVSATARREDSAGGALVVDLADRPLASLLSGRDDSTRVSVDNADVGVLSLRGSTRSIRGALESCMTF